MEPLLKWAGGKRLLLPKIYKYINKENIINENKTLYEPFVGGGSLFLDLELPNCVINDFNKELVNVYVQVKNKPYQLIKLLEEHKNNHSQEYYLAIRELDRKPEYKKMTKIEKAARIIYLNKTCYNGLYRVNAKGHFNVPMGKYENPDIVMKDKILRLSKYLRNNNIKIKCGDFADAVKTSKLGDIVYFDPPYDYEEDGFTSYNSGGFTKNDLVRLKECCDELIAKGCEVIVSNNDTSFVNNLFSGEEYTIEHIEAHRLINCDGKNRRKEKEVIIYGKSK